MDLLNRSTSSLSGKGQWAAARNK